MRPHTRPKFDSKRPRINNQIRIPEVQVIDENGTMLGIMAVHEALKIADERELDLVEVGPTAKPPIAKILDFGKYMYQKEKRGHTKKQATNEVKTVRVGFRTEKHDIVVRGAQTDKFLKKGHRVRVQLTLRGKEREMSAMGREKLEKFITILEEPFAKEMEIHSYPGGLEILLRPDKN